MMTKLDENGKKKLLGGVWKKAAGYVAVETQEEYALVDGEMALVKKKIIRKDVPPDTAALKLLLGDETPDPVSREELEEERRRLTEEFFRRLENKT